MPEWLLYLYAEAVLCAVALPVILWLAKKGEEAEK